MPTMKSTLVCATLGAALLLSACQKPAPAASPSPGGLSEADKTFYALGAALGRNLVVFKLTDEQLKHVQLGLADSAQGRPPQVDPAAYQMQVQQLFMAKQAEAAQEEKKKGQDFVATAAKEAGAVQLPSGVVVQTLTEGKGPSPTPADVVRVHYHGTFTDGKVFDSSVQRGQPAEFSLGGVIACWTQGVQKLKVGGKARLVCPSETAYGDRGQPPTIPGGAALVFEVELLAINPKGAPQGATGR